MKKKKEKVFIFVDSENIGNLVPENLNENTKVFFYYSNPNVLKSLEPLIREKRFVMININQGQEMAKNEMDLCIIASLAKRLYKQKQKKGLKHCRFIILSNDKGYDKAIDILKKTFDFEGIERQGMSLRKYCDQTPDPYEELPQKLGQLPADKNLRKKAKKFRTWSSFKQNLTPGEKKMLRLQYAVNKASAPVWFEFDFYSSQYVLMYSGSAAGRFSSLEEGNSEYTRLLNIMPKSARIPAENMKPKKRVNKSRRPRKVPAKKAAAAAPKLPLS